MYTVQLYNVVVNRVYVLYTCVYRFHWNMTGWKVERLLLNIC